MVKPSECYIWYIGCWPKQQHKVDSLLYSNCMNDGICVPSTGPYPDSGVHPHPPRSQLEVHPIGSSLQISSTKSSHCTYVSVVLYLGDKIVVIQFLVVHWRFLSDHPKFPLWWLNHRWLNEPPSLCSVYGSDQGRPVNKIVGDPGLWRTVWEENVWTVGRETSSSYIPQCTRVSVWGSLCWVALWLTIGATI